MDTIKKIKEWLFDVMGWTPFEIKLLTPDGNTISLQGRGEVSIHGDVHTDVLRLYITRPGPCITFYGNLIGGTGKKFGITREAK